MPRVPGTFKERPGRLIERPLPPIIRELNPTAVDHRYYALDDCAILVCREPSGPGGALRWHLSISHASRYPTWDEIKVARYALTPPEITMAMILPPPDEYVNVEQQDNVFHLNEIDVGLNPA